MVFKRHTHEVGSSLGTRIYAYFVWFAEAWEPEPLHIYMVCHGSGSRFCACLCSSLMLTEQNPNIVIWFLFTSREQRGHGRQYSPQQQQQRPPQQYQQPKHEQQHQQNKYRQGTFAGFRRSSSICTQQQQQHMQQQQQQHFLQKQQLSQNEIFSLCIVMVSVAGQCF